MRKDVERTADGRYVVVDGRRRRTADPALPDDVRGRLLHHLGAARVQLAKTGLGERGPAWWEQPEDARRARWAAALRELED